MKRKVTLAVGSAAAALVSLAAAYWQDYVGREAGLKTSDVFSLGSALLAVGALALAACVLVVLQGRTSRKWWHVVRPVELLSWFACIVSVVILIVNAWAFVSNLH